MNPVIYETTVQDAITDGSSCGEIGRDPIVLAFFHTARPSGPAYGSMRTMTWAEFTLQMSERRVGAKDGPAFTPTRFKLEANGGVRRLAVNAIARTAIALDCEINSQTWEAPPSLNEAVERIENQNWAAAIYTSYSHTAAAPRYRIVIPISDEMPTALPTVEVIADRLGLLGVTDKTKIGPASIFYLPSTSRDSAPEHETRFTEGGAIEAAWLISKAQALFAMREAKLERVRLEAVEVAIRRQEKRAQRAVDPAESLIEDIRSRLDLSLELIAHGYEPAGKLRFLYPGSSPPISLIPGG